MNPIVGLFVVAALELALAAAVLIQNPRRPVNHPASRLMCRTAAVGCSGC